MIDYQTGSPAGASPASNQQKEFHLPDQRDKGIDFSLLFGILSRRKGIIFATVVILTSLIAFVSTQLEPVYSATSAILLEPRETRIVNMESVVEELPTDSSMIETQIKVLRSTHFAERVIDELNLLELSAFNPLLNGDDQPASLPEQLFSMALDWLPGQWVSKIGLAAQQSDDGLEVAAATSASDGDFTRTSVGDSGKSLTDEQTAAMLQQNAVNAIASTRLQKQLNIQQSGSSYVITVTHSSTDRDRAASVANAVAELYVNGQLETKRSATARAANWLSGRINELRQQLQMDEETIEQYRTENQLQLGDEDKLNQQELSAVNAQLLTLEAERAEKQATLDLAQALQRDGKDIKTLAGMFDSPMIIALYQNKLALDREESRLSQEYGPRHSKMIQLTADRTNIVVEIEAHITRGIRELATNIDLIESRRSLLEARLGEARAGSADRNRASIELRLLERDAEATRLLYTAFLKRFKELNEQQDILESSARVISTAPLPDEPSFPKPKLMTTVGGIGSMILGILLAFVVDSLDRTVRSSSEAEELLNAPVLGMIPQVQAPKRGQSMHNFLLETPPAPYTEAVGAVRAGIWFSNVDQPANIVLVTSSVPDEGKTALSLTLGAAAANASLKTVVVDLDLRLPSIGPAIDKYGGGILEYVAGEKTIEDIIVEHDTIRDLHFITVRNLAANPAEVLASRQIANLIDTLSNRYDYIVLDTPPILGLADARFVSNMADVAVFVVRWGKTKRETAQRGLATLRSTGAKVAGVVMTQVNIKRQKKYSSTDVVQYSGKYQKYYT